MIEKPFVLMIFATWISQPAPLPNGQRFETLDDCMIEESRWHTRTLELWNAGRQINFTASDIQDHDGMPVGSYFLRYEGPENHTLLTAMGWGMCARYDSLSAAELEKFLGRVPQNGNP